AGAAGQAAGPAACVVEGPARREADRAGRRRGVVGEGRVGGSRLDVAGVVSRLGADGVLNVVRQSGGGQSERPRAGAGGGVEDLADRAEVRPVPVEVRAEVLDADPDTREPGGADAWIIRGARQRASPTGAVVEGVVGRKRD